MRIKYLYLIAMVFVLTSQGLYAQTFKLPGAPIQPTPVADEELIQTPVLAGIITEVIIPQSGNPADLNGILGVPVSLSEFNFVLKQGTLLPLSSVAFHYSSEAPVVELTERLGSRARLYLKLEGEEFRNALGISIERLGEEPQPCESMRCDEHAEVPVCYCRYVLSKFLPGDHMLREPGMYVVNVHFYFPHGGGWQVKKIYFKLAPSVYLEAPDPED